MFGIAVLSLRAADVGGGTEGAETTQTTQTVPPSRVASFVDVAAANGGAGWRSRRGCRRGVVSADGEGGADLAGLNPLRPCGACREWLIKIAEVNPGFKVLMFSDVTCEEVFVRGWSSVSRGVDGGKVDATRRGQLAPIREKITFFVIVLVASRNPPGLPRRISCAHIRARSSVRTRGVGRWA